MPRLEYADTATETAMAFVKQHYFWGGRPRSARQEDGVWLIEIDIGITKTRLGHVKLDAETGQVIEYLFPLPEEGHDRRH